MSQEARNALVDSKNILFQRESQRTDLENISLVQTGLIAGLTWLCIEKNYPVEITAVRSDHHDDSALGEHCHWNGYCADLWPLNSQTPGDYMDANDGRFQTFLRDLSACPYLFQIGLAGEADTASNMAAAGPTAFVDDGADHIHFGCQNP